MIFRFIFWLIFKLKGWAIEGEIPPETDRCVLVAIPHTSNWDIIFASAAFYIMKVPMKFTIKKEWFRFPFNLIIGPLGGIAIDRSPKKPGEKRKSMVEAMAHLFEERDSLAVMVTPEGTRKRTDALKTGLWHVAKEAGVPICIGYLDYKKKRAGVGMVIWPKDVDEDMKAIAKFGQTVTPKYPENFGCEKLLE
ncbi:MAG: 1-acyl-sn-glycerol-3-phosphate acyltransferase [Chitinophagales bacterium]|nr:1-acyl-sn-glycerol-3-phosphate acyltransferase [Chitinophagales bacterium]